MATEEPFFTPGQVGKRYGFTEAALAQMRYRGTGPRYIKLGARSIRYRQSDLDAWIDASVRTRTDERTAPQAG